MTKLMKFKEGIISAYEIYDSPSFFNRIFNISYTFDAMRFEYKSSVIYAYISSNDNTIYILLLYSLTKNKGHGKKNITQLIDYANQNGYNNIIVTVSKKSPKNKGAEMFYKQCGFEIISEDMKHIYMKFDHNKKTTQSNKSNDVTDYNKNTLKYKYNVIDILSIIIGLVSYMFRIRNSKPIVVKNMEKATHQNEYNNYT
jgi:GNAT superfamily N-acetyltransferase